MNEMFFFSRSYEHSVLPHYRPIVIYKYMYVIDKRTRSVQYTFINNTCSKICLLVSLASSQFVFDVFQIDRRVYAIKWIYRTVFTFLEIWDVKKIINRVTYTQRFQQKHMIIPHTNSYFFFLFFYVEWYHVRICTCKWN